MIEKLKKEVEEALNNSRITDDDANFYIDLHNSLSESVKEGLIDKFSIDPEENTVYLEKTIVPKVAVKKIDVDIRLTSSGVTWGHF